MENGKWVSIFHFFVFHLGWKIEMTVCTRTHYPQFYYTRINKSTHNESHAQACTFIWYKCKTLRMLLRYTALWQNFHFLLF